MNKHEYTIMILEHLQHELTECAKVATEHTKREIKQKENRNETLASLYALHLVNSDCITLFIKREKNLLERGEN